MYSHCALGLFNVSLLLKQNKTDAVIDQGQFTAKETKRKQRKVK